MVKVRASRIAVVRFSRRFGRSNKVLRRKPTHTGATVMWPVWGVDPDRGALVSVRAGVKRNCPC